MAQSSSSSLVRQVSSLPNISAALDEEFGGNPQRPLILILIVSLTSSNEILSGANFSSYPWVLFELSGWPALKFSVTIPFL